MRQGKDGRIPPERDKGHGEGERIQDGDRRSGREIGLPEEVRRYLEKYGIGDWEMEPGDISDVSMAVVVPALMEFENIKKLLESLASNDAAYFNKTLIIFIVNNTASCSDEARQDNLCTLELLRGIIRGTGHGGIEDKVISSGLRVGLIDASSEGHELPQKDGGVGLARKIGMDLALTKFNFNSGDKKILVCLDSDCTVDNNYLTEIYRNFHHRDLSAAAVNFSHEAGQTDEYPKEHAFAITCYEIFLRYYVLGLTYADSPYAFHTIGSTMACDHTSYIKVEGMNKRKAAEDFYFMEKLAKFTKVSKIATTTVYPSPRGSWRVPFGTGQRVNRHLSGVQDEYFLYNPKSFKVLKEWLSVYNSPEAHEATYYLAEAKKIHASLFDFLANQNFESDYSRIIQNSRKPEQLFRQKSGWFDGFRTLKLIHYLRDNGFPPCPMFDALDEIFNLMGVEFDRKSGAVNMPPNLDHSIFRDHFISSDIPPLEEQHRYLELLRKIS